MGNNFELAKFGWLVLRFARIYDGRIHMSEGEPTGQEALKQQIVDGLRFALNDWKDGIPSEILHSTFPDAHYKVRKAWFQVIAGDLSFIMRRVWDEGLQIPEELFAAISDYYNVLTNDTEFKDRLTTQEDIDKAEAIVNKIIAELEK